MRNETIASLRLFYDPEQQAAAREIDGELLAWHVLRKEASRG